MILAVLPRLGVLLATCLLLLPFEARAVLQQQGQSCSPDGVATGATVNGATDDGNSLVCISGTWQYPVYVPRGATASADASCGTYPSGAIRYNSTLGNIEYCTNSIWNSVSRYDIAMFMPTTPGASVVVQVVLPRAATYPASLTGSSCVAKTGATSSTTITINKVNAGTVTAVATAVFAAGGSANQTCTFTAASAISTAAGNVLEFAFPATPDATLANIAITLMGTHQ